MFFGCVRAQVEFFIDANGMLEVTATNKGTEHRRRIQIKQGKGRFTDEQIEKLHARAEKFARQDRLEKEALETMATFRQYVAPARPRACTPARTNARPHADSTLWVVGAHLCCGWLVSDVRACVLDGVGYLAD